MQIDATVGADQAQVAEIRAQLENAKWELSQTTVYAPADGYAINVQLRPGSISVAFPGQPVDDVCRERISGHRAVRTRTSCTRWSRATKPSSRSRPVPARS